MKLKREDKVIVIAGRDKGKTGKVIAVLPSENKVLVEGVNIAKRHTKPSQKNPRGGILDITKPLDVSKVMVLDPATGQPARIGYTIKDNGTKERIFKVSPNHTTNKKAKKSDTSEVSASKSSKASTSEVQADQKAGKK